MKIDISSNSFGDQIITIETKDKTHTYINQEGEWADLEEISKLVDILTKGNL